MHMGRTDAAPGSTPFAMLADGTADGMISTDGLVMGTYCHGLLGSGALRRALLARAGGHSTGTDHANVVDAALNELARELERHLDLDALVALTREHRP